MEFTFSNNAREDLRNVLAQDIGSERTSQFSEEDLDDLGQRLLRLAALALKRERSKFK